MIKEISNFVDALGPEIKGLGVKPKEGLHILVKLKDDEGQLYIDKESAKWTFTRKKSPEPEDLALLKKSAVLSQLSWCVNTNKCFDLPIKAIHSCSPYCIAIKRENLGGGEKYKQNTKSQVFERISSYFNKSYNLLDSETDKQRVLLFEQSLNTEAKFNNWLELISDYSLVKDAEYVIFYLDEPFEKYEMANEKYLADKLFNTNEYNRIIGSNTFGTSDFFNGYPTKKPFLTHQSASFDIAARISAKEARSLFDFQEIISRGILPKPLPIFLHIDEIKSVDKKNRNEVSIQLIKKEAELGRRIGYKELMESLYKDYRDQLGNYYLLFYDRGVIKDFDFVSKFDYLLHDEFDNPWKVEDWFNAGHSESIENIFQLQQVVLIPIFNNALVTRTKNDAIQYKYFDDIESKYCKSDITFLMVHQYRKAFYDYIYKSKKQAVSQKMFNSILQTGIVEDIRLDEVKIKFHSQERSIREKMNIWFSLSENFNQLNNKNKETMASKLQEHREFIKKLTKSETHIESDDQYAFSVGQVIYYLLSKSKTADRSYKRLEPFMQQVHSKELNKAIFRMFDAYKHENFSANFRNPFAEVMAFETKSNVRDLMPTILAGIFSENTLFSDREQNEVEADISTDEIFQ